MPPLQDVSLRFTWPNVGGPLVVALLVGLAGVGVGLTILRWAARGRGLSVFELTVAPALGLGALGYIADLPFMTGAVDMRPIYVAEIVVGLALVIWQGRAVNANRAASVRAAAGWRATAVRAAGWSIVGWFACKLLVANASPISDGDSLLHYALYSQSLSAGVTFDEILLLKNFPLADLNRIVQHIYAMAGAAGGESALHLMNFVFIAAIAALAQGIAAGLLRACSWANPLPVLAFLTIRELIYTGFTAKLDYGVALLELAALACWMTWRDRRLWLLAVSLGLALCARSNSLRFVAVLPVLWIADQWWTRRADEGMRRTVARTVAVGIGTLLIAAPPYWMQQHIYGNPFFPMFNGVLGHYRHYYEWNLLDTIRYHTEYGWFGGLAGYLQIALLDWTSIPGVRLPPNTGYGLSVLLLAAPLALSRDRRVLWLLGFLGLGFATWWVAQAHTHRTLISVAVVAAILAASAITRLRAARPAAYISVSIAVAGLAAWTTWDFLGFNNLNLTYYYAFGGWTKTEFNDVFDRQLFGDRVMPSRDLDAIHALVGRAHIAALNLSPFTDPRLVRTKRLAISTRSMAEIAADPQADAVDRRIARETLASPYLNRQARDLASRLWPSAGAQRALAPGEDFRWYLTASWDAIQFQADELLADPTRLPPLLRFEGIRYLLVPQQSVFARDAIAGLTPVWSSDQAVLFRVEPG
jgi:hypothetical protein